MTASAEPSRRRRFLVSYRVSLMVAIPGLVVLLSGLIILQSYLDGLEAA